MRIELLTTTGCHLCEQAEAIVLRVAPQAEIHRIDIAEDDELLDRWGERIPVLRYRDRQLCWPFSLLDVQAMLRDPD